MPPKKNKPSRNGFWQFALECRDKSSNKNMNFEQIKEYAARKWSNMSKEEKKPYEVMAQHAKDNYSASRLTSEGLDVDQIARNENEKALKVSNMKQDIKKRLQTAKMNNSLDELMFFIVHVNHLTYYEALDRFYIAELSITWFSLRDGVNTQDVFHEIVKPGKLPLGHYGHAKIHSKETHQLLEVVQEEPYEDNTEEVFRKMIQYLKKHSKDGLVPVLYSPDKTKDMITKVMDTFCDDFKFPTEIKVYQLEHLFFALRNEVAGKAVWPSETFSYTEIEKDVYSHCPKISCEFHELADITVYCSRSIVIRYGYIICDNCCKDLGIDVMPGWHVPVNARVAKSSALSSRCSSFSSNLNEEKSRFKPWSRADTLDSSNYDENFPSLGGGRSTASTASGVSFRTMMADNASVEGSRNGASVCDSFGSLTLSEQQRRRNIQGLKFPKHAYEDSQ